MKKFVLLLAAIICIQFIAQATPDIVTTGPYKISFDIGMPKEAYKVDIEYPKTTESLSGDISTIYTVNLINNTGLLRKAVIIVTSYEKEQPVPVQEELVRIEKNSIFRIEDVYDVEVAGRIIDGFRGSIGSGTMKTSLSELKIYAAIYYQSSTTTVSIVSSYPWDEGTLQLLKTIHIERNATG